MSVYERNVRPKLDWTEAAELVLSELERHDDDICGIKKDQQGAVREFDKLQGRVDEMNRQRDGMLADIDGVKKDLIIKIDEIKTQRQKVSDRGFSVFLQMLPWIVTFIALGIMFKIQQVVK